VKPLQRLAAFSSFISDYLAFRRLSKPAHRFSMTFGDRLVCLKEKTADSEFDRHYIYHTAWAARAVAALKPAFHVDISSSLYFCSIVSAFVPVRYFEFRPPHLSLDNLFLDRADLNSLPFESGSIASVSCMHVVEHAGLGRYGDPIDPDGDLKAIEELKRICAPGGSVLFVVPVGRPRIRFNAHRLYSPGQIMECFSPFSLHEFAFIDDRSSNGPIHTVPIAELPSVTGEGCGCFWFIKNRVNDGDGK
jgi:SAM-dependent methyltransferase